MLGFASQCQQTHCWAADRSPDWYVKKNCCFINGPWNRTTESTNCSKTHSKWFRSAPSRTGCLQPPGREKWAEANSSQSRWSTGGESYEAGKIDTRAHNEVGVTKRTDRTITCFMGHHLRVRRKWPLKRAVSKKLPKFKQRDLFPNWVKHQYNCSKH